MNDVQYVRVKNWEHFQHYKDRNPPWIKLATNTFQNYDFSRLQDASKLLAVCIWTLAARYEVGKAGEIPWDLEWIKSQCGLGTLITEKHMQELINKGFIICDSNPLASCKQSACLEGEGEGEGEIEGEIENITQLATPSKSKQPDLETVREAWNAIAAECGLKPCRSLSPGRKTALRARLKDPDWRAHYPEALHRLRDITWIRGTNGHQPRGIDWFLQPDTLTKILEGTFDDHRKEEPPKEEYVYDWATEQQNNMLRAKGIIP